MLLQGIWVGWHLRKFERGSDVNFFMILKNNVSYVFFSKIRTIINLAITLAFVLFGDIFSYKVFIYFFILIFLNLVTYMYLKDELYPIYIMARHVPDKEKDLVNTVFGGALYLAWMAAIAFCMIYFIA